MTLKDEETRNEIEGKYCIVQYNSVTSHNQYSGKNILSSDDTFKNFVS